MQAGHWTSVRHSATYDSMTDRVHMQILLRLLVPASLEVRGFAVAVSVSGCEGHVSYC